MHSMHFAPDDDQVMAPWGIVTPDFWVDPAREQAQEPAQEPASATAAPAAPTPGPTAQPEENPAAPPPPPEAYRERIDKVVAAFATPGDQARLAEAGVEAERLDEEITAQYGPAHTHTVNVRELRGWLAHLSGESGVAVRWYLHTTGLQMAAWGPGHELTQGSAQRAAHIWMGITDPVEALAVGSELMAMLVAVTGHDSKAARKVRAGMKKLQEGEE
ncbi:hypothetical protein [Streptomyces griseocarneus]|uniref:hypothetical protein n=1 Tax=Streptomyces griseocarneus TaxID=51201 RepID=UPI001999DCF6|nr:hypothetical protein [Streptomyces griseocarneus]MBZ6473479.1 hypothetical protein [Streptomyces griseocarneus]GHG56683.1 hypothetical protein GCM10018779_21110 [Streptomyces griseocarneus]